jgi:glutamine phosphoribosylpyrophosphate amidotransferase
VSGEAALANLQGDVAIGPTRHSTLEGLCRENARLASEINAGGGGMAVAHNSEPTNLAPLAGHLIPQESPPRWSVQPRAMSDTDVMTELLASEVDLSLEDAIVCTMPRLEDLTETAVVARISPVRGLCTDWGTGSCPSPIPDAAVGDLRPFATTQLPTLPLPNPEPEVAR